MFHQRYKSLEVILLLSASGSVVLSVVVLLLGWHRSFAFMDDIQHLVAGVVVGLFMMVWLVHNEWFGLEERRDVRLLMVVGLAMLIGVGWEFFEFWFDHIWMPLAASTAESAQPSMRDTMGDLAFDFIGAVIAFYGAYPTLTKSSETMNQSSNG